MSLLAKPIAFVRREFFVATSYRFQFVFQLLSSIFLVATFYFVARLISPERLAEAGVATTADYFAFVLVGIAATTFLESTVTAFPERLRQTMTEGTLEMMIASPTRPVLVLGLPALWAFLFQALRSVFVLGFGVLLFGARLDVDLAATAVVALCTAAAYSMLGLLSVACILVVKRGDPVAWAVTQAAAVVGGAYFPIELLPSWLKTLALCLPMTYSYRALRATLLAGAGLGDVWRDVLVLLAFTAALLPAALVACRLAVRHAKRCGTVASF